MQGSKPSLNNSLKSGLQRVMGIWIGRAKVNCKKHVLFGINRPMQGSKPSLNNSLKSGLQRLMGIWIGRAKVNCKKHVLFGINRPNTLQNRGHLDTQTCEFLQYDHLTLWEVDEKKAHIPCSCSELLRFCW
jgi:hypothetical protein